MSFFLMLKKKYWEKILNFMGDETKIINGNCFDSKTIITFQRTFILQ